MDGGRPPPENSSPAETPRSEVPSSASAYLRKKKPGASPALAGASRFRAAAKAIAVADLKGNTRPVAPPPVPDESGSTETAPPSASKIPPPQSTLKRDARKAAATPGGAVAVQGHGGTADGVAVKGDQAGGGKERAPSDVGQMLWMVTVNNDCALLVAARAALAQPKGAAAYAKSEALDRVVSRMRPYLKNGVHNNSGRGGDEGGGWGDVEGWDPERRFRVETGGEGATPLHQCLLKGSPESLLAARAILKRYPGTLLDTYTGDAFGGENCVHMAIVGGLERVPGEGEGGMFAVFDETAKALPRGALAKLMADDTSVRGRFFGPGQICYYGGLPLSFAASVGTPWHLSWLLERGAHIDSKDGATGNTALHLAVLHRNKAAYVFLRQRGAANLENGDGLTPMLLAVRKGDADMFSFLVSQHATPMWQYGATRCNLYAIDELHGSSRFYDKKRKTAIELVAQHNLIELIAPSNDCLEYLSGIRMPKRTPEQKKTFRMSDGPHPPDVNRSILLIVAENCWASFAGPLVRRRFALCLAHLTVVTAVTLLDDESAGAVGQLVRRGRMLAAASTCYQAAVEVWTIIANAGRHASPPSTIMSLVLLNHCALFLVALAIEAFPGPGFTVPKEESGESALAQSISAGSLVLGFLYLAHFLGCFRATGPLVCMLIEIVRVDVARFALVFSALLLGYGTAFYELLRPAALKFIPATTRGGLPTPVVSYVEGFSSWPEAMLTTFRSALGDTSYESMTAGLAERLEADSSVSVLGGRIVVQPRLVMFYLLYSTFLFGSSIIFINLLIAMMGRTFAVVDDRNIGEYMIRRTEVMLRLEATQTKKQRAKCFKEFLNEPLVERAGQEEGDMLQDYGQLRIECKESSKEKK